MDISKKDLSELIKSFIKKINKEITFNEGKEEILLFRNLIWEKYQQLFREVTLNEYCIMPLKSDKTIVYYLYHLNRIEDITSNTLIKRKEQIFFKDNYDKLLNSPIISTGNELMKDELIKFSNKINIFYLKEYITRVFKNTNDIIKEMTFSDSKIKISEDAKKELLNLNVVSSQETANWLIDYWCNKTYAGLIAMPFTRHQLMHIEGCYRIHEYYLKKDKIKLGASL